MEQVFTQNNLKLGKGREEEEEEEEDIRVSYRTNF
jgi:hypothetical protein